MDLNRAGGCHPGTGLVLLLCVVPSACERAEAPAPEHTAKQTAPAAAPRARPVTSLSLQDGGPATSTPVAPGPPADAASVPPQAVAVQIRQAFLQERFHDVWELMSQSARERFLRSQPATRPSKPTVAADTFVRYWRQQFAASPGTRDDIRASSVIGVNVAGAVATVTIRDRDGHDQPIELIREDGVWKLNRMPD